MEQKTKIGIASVGASALILVTAVTLTLLGGPLGAGNSTVKVNVPVGTYYPNAIFNVTISCAPTRPVKAWELQVNYNKNVLNVLTVTEGTFFNPYPTFFNPGVIDNVNGKVTKLYDLVVGVGNKTTTGTFVTLQFKAINYGFSYINLTGVGLTNETIYIPRNVTNSSVRIYAPYDMNLDGTINMLDLLDVANFYGQSGALGWIKEDIDDNGIVNVFDLVLVSTHWGNY